MNICPYCGTNAVDNYKTPLVNCPRCGTLTPFGSYKASQQVGRQQGQQPPPVMHPYPYYPPYQYPYQPPHSPIRTKREFSGIFVIIGFSLAVVALLLSWMGLFNSPVALIAATISIIGALQANKAGRLRGLSIAAVIISTFAVISTAGFTVFSRANQTNISEKTSYTDEINLAAKGLTAIQNHYGNDVKIDINGVMVIEEDVKLVRIEMKISQGDKTNTKRFSVSTDKGMTYYAVDEGFWDEELKVAIFDYTQHQASSGTVMLDVNKVVEKAKQYGYVHE